MVARWTTGGEASSLLGGLAQSPSPPSTSWLTIGSFLPNTELAATVSDILAEPSSRGSASSMCGERTSDCSPARHVVSDDDSPAPPTVAPPSKTSSKKPAPTDWTGPDTSEGQRRETGLRPSCRRQLDTPLDIRNARVTHSVGGAEGWSPVHEGLFGGGSLLRVPWTPLMLVSPELDHRFLPPGVEVVTIRVAATTHASCRTNVVPITPAPRGLRGSAGVRSSDAGSTA